MREITILFHFQTLEDLRDLEDFFFLKSFLDFEDRLLNNIEKLEDLRSLSLTIKTGKKRFCHAANS